MSDVTEIAAGLPALDVFYYDRTTAPNLALAEQAAIAGAYVFYEPSSTIEALADTELFERCAATAHVVKYSHEQFGEHPILLRQINAPIEIETIGRQGIRFRLGSGEGRSDWKHLSAWPVRAERDATGSGDWCTAGFLHGIMRNEIRPTNHRLVSADEIEASLQVGQALAALNCLCDGPRGLMYACSLDEIRQALESLSAGNEVSITARHHNEASVDWGACAVCRWPQADSHPE